MFLPVLVLPEYPGHNYAFNWCLNGDGVTPLNRSAFRICKPLDLKVAGLQPLQSPLKVRLSGPSLARSFFSEYT